MRPIASPPRSQQTPGSGITRLYRGLAAVPVAPASAAAGRHLALTVAGASTDMLPEPVAEYAYPHGPV